MQEKLAAVPLDEEALQELLFDRLRLVLLPPGAGSTPSSKKCKSSAHKEPTLEDFIARTRQLLELEEQQEVELADAELCNYSASGAQVCLRDGVTFRRHCCPHDRLLRSSTCLHRLCIV